jgi:hypothetical protein
VVALDVSRQELRAQLIYFKLFLRGTVSLSATLLTSAADLKRLRQPGASEERYVRPSRRYDLPAYADGMQCCLASERYLRPTRYCNSRAPEVVALAHALGAYQLPDHEFAEAAFQFAKEKMFLEICPVDSVEETLQRGTGTCFQLISVFIALCRAAGIKARYKIFSTTMIQAWREAVVDVDPLVRKWYNSLGYFLLEGEGEAYVNGRWVTAHVGPTAERQAAAGIPITRFGEDALGIWFFARPGTIMYRESVPIGMGWGSKFLHWISPGSMERVNVSIQQQIQRGRSIFEEMGGAEAYDREARARQGPQAPQVDLEPRKELRFED